LIAAHYNPGPFMNPESRIQNPQSLCVVGLGLMGASFALALRASGYAGRLSGISRSEETRRRALERGIVDEAGTDLGMAAGAEVVVLCTPVRLLIEQIGQLGAICAQGTIITDMGSTKTAIVRAMDALPAGLRAVGSHPMCGKEQAGIDAAEGTLYRGAPWILTRTQRSDETSFQIVKRLAEAVGAVPREIDVERHDALLAFASHLPYMVSTAMVAATDQFGLSEPEVWQVMAGGFRDTSRVAASDPTMWLDILLTNRDTVLGAVRDYQFALDQFTALLERGDEPGLRAYIEAAAQARRSHYGY
jgi:prephenate dehydrogenase